MALLNKLLHLVGNAEQRVILVAPFVKVGIVQQVVDHIANTVEIKLFTRWKPEEIALGVSDLEVWDLLAPRENAHVFLCQNLHAKCFLSDEVALVGSANLTSRGLGTHHQSNLECLAPLPSDHKDVARLLQDLNSGSIEATAEIYRICRDAVKMLPQSVPISDSTFEESTAFTGANGWLPHLRNPDQLFLIYTGKSNSVTRAAYETGQLDLSFLHVASGLSEVQFNRVVYSRLTQINFFHLVFEMATVPRRFGEYRQLTRRFLRSIHSERSETDVWQTALRWILHFAASDFVVDTPHYSEILQRRHTDSKKTN